MQSENIDATASEVRFENFLNPLFRKVLIAVPVGVLLSGVVSCLMPKKYESIAVVELRAYTNILGLGHSCSAKDKKDWENAIPFLDGDTNQRQQALSLLSQSKNPSALSLFKKSILTGSLDRYDIDIAVEFIRANPEKDPQFIKDFRATLKKLPTHLPSATNTTNPAVIIPKRSIRSSKNSIRFPVANLSMT